jgi:cold shock protein
MSLGGVTPRCLGPPNIYGMPNPSPDGRTSAIVEWWSDEEGWGALQDSEEMPGGAFVHFSAIEMGGYKTLCAGQKVDARIEGPLPFDQDGYRYRATQVWPLM